MGYFGCFRVFGIILVILGAFWSFCCIMIFFRFWGCFVHFEDFRGILVILEVSRIF